MTLLPGLAPTYRTPMAWLPGLNGTLAVQCRLRTIKPLPQPGGNQGTLPLRPEGTYGTPGMQCIHSLSWTVPHGRIEHTWFRAP